MWYRGKLWTIGIFSMSYYECFVHLEKDMHLGNKQELKGCCGSAKLAGSPEPGIMSTWILAASWHNN